MPPSDDHYSATRLIRRRAATLLTKVSISGRRYQGNTRKWRLSPETNEFREENFIDQLTNRPTVYNFV